MRDFLKKFWFKPYPYVLAGGITRNPVRGRLLILLTLLALTFVLLLAVPAWVCMRFLADADNDLHELYEEYGRGWLALLSPWNPQ